MVQLMWLPEYRPSNVFVAGRSQKTRSDLERFVQWAELGKVMQLRHLTSTLTLGYFSIQFMCITCVKMMCGLDAYFLC